jgi:hypothetical protein
MALTTSNTRLQNELTVLGARPLVNFDLVSSRPFQFAWSIASGVTTASDLTAQVNCLDDELRTNYGFTANNPDLILHITGFSAQVDMQTETSVISQQLFSQVAINHQAAGGRNQSINMNQFITSASTSTVIDATPLNIQSRQGMIYHELSSPWQVNLRSDTFQVRPTAAVTFAVAANIVGTLAIYGFAWPSAQGESSGINCPDQRTARALGMAMRVRPPVSD